jgi:hypothetical protein
MHLVEIVLPLNDNEGPFDSEKFAALRERLTERFGGLTAFTRSPAQGTIREGDKTVRDEIVVFEVLTETLEQSWWTSYRRRLEGDFQQDKIIVSCMGRHLALRPWPDRGRRCCFGRPVQAPSLTRSAQPTLSLRIATSWTMN